jgi:hypothetical protein
MSFIKTVKTRIQGRRKLLFEAYVKNKEISEAQALRDLIDFFFKENKP